VVIGPRDLAAFDLGDEVVPLLGGEDQVGAVRGGGVADRNYRVKVAGARGQRYFGAAAVLGAVADAAVLLARRGDLPATRRAFEDAARLYQALGAAWDLRRADSRLRGYGIRRGPARSAGQADPRWDALTPTEGKIAYLVAGGRSNLEIAAELSVLARAV